MYLECPSWHPGLLHKGPDWHSGRERERAAGGRLLWWVVAPWCCPARVGGGGAPQSPQSLGSGRAVLEPTWQVHSHASPCLPGGRGPCLSQLSRLPFEPLPRAYSLRPAAREGRGPAGMEAGPWGPLLPSRPGGPQAPRRPGPYSPWIEPCMPRAAVTGWHSGGDTPREQVPASFTAFVSRLPFPFVSTTHAGNSLPFCPPEKITPQATKSRS